MRANQMLDQLRDATAAVGELLDHQVEILSLHIGPAPLPPTLRVMAGPFTQRLQAGAKCCELTGEYRYALDRVEVAWVSGTPPAFGAGPLASLGAAIDRLDAELARAN